MCNTRTKSNTRNSSQVTLVLVNPNATLYLRSEDSLSDIPASYKQLRDGVSALASNFSAANLATWLVRNRNWQLSTANQVTDVVLRLDMTGYKNLFVVKNGATFEYTGSLEGYAQKPASAGDYSGTTVRFRYNGGQHPQDYRVVKVSKMDGKHLKGTDLVQNAPRSYLINKIDMTTLQQVG